MITGKDKNTLDRILSNIDTKEELLDVIESALDSFYENVNDGSGLMNIVRNKFPDADDVINKLTVYYDDDDILDVFDDDTKLENIKDSWSLDNYVNEKVDEETSSIFNIHEQEIEDLLNATENKQSYFDLNSDDIYVNVRVYFALDDDGKINDLRADTYYLFDSREIYYYITLKNN